MLPPTIQRSLTHAVAASAAVGFAIGVGAVGQARSVCSAGEPCSANPGWAPFLFAAAGSAGFGAVLLPWVVLLALRTPAEINLLLARRTTLLATIPALAVLVPAFGIAILSDDAYPGTSRDSWIVRGLLVISLALLPLVVGPKRWKLFAPIAVCLAIAAVAWALYLALPAFLLILYATLLLLAAITSVAVPIRSRAAPGLTLD